VTLGNPTLTFELKERLAAGITAETAGRGIAELATWRHRFLAPSAVAWVGGITVFHQGSDYNGTLWYAYSPDGASWGGDTQVLNVGMSISPSCVVY
jgi:hypothetical protein